jgi:cytochrome P450
MRDEELAARRHEAGADDLLAAMLASEPSLSNQEIVNELLIVLMAAQEPPAIALANVLYELAGRPGTTDAFLAMPSLRRSIVAEVLRLRPSAQAALRRLKVPTQVGEQLLPAGTTVALPSLLLHRDPVAFPEPDEFRAKRFADATGPPRPYLPFGGGARRCIGEALAEAEFRAVLPAALRRLRFARTWPREERMVVRATVLVPCRSALVAAAPR